MITVLSFLVGVVVGMFVWNIFIYFRNRYPYIPKVGAVYGESGNPFAENKAEVMEIAKGESGRIFVKYKYWEQYNAYERSCSVDYFNRNFRNF